MTTFRAWVDEFEGKALEIAAKIIRGLKMHKGQQWYNENELAARYKEAYEAFIRQTRGS